jgi:SPP1 family predicted phage head-tail adaptor
VTVGRYRTRITIQQATQAVQAEGDTVPTWATFKAAFAEVLPVRATERVIGDATRGQASHTIRMQWLDGVTSGMRVTTTGLTFDVVGVTADRTGRHTLTLECVARV